MIDFSAVAAVFSAYVVGVALFLSHETVSGAYRRAQEWIDRACGAVIVALGVRQALRLPRGLFAFAQRGAPVNWRARKKG